MNFSRVSRTKCGRFVRKREQERRNKVVERIQHVKKGKDVEQLSLITNDTNNSSEFEENPALSGRRIVEINVLAEYLDKKGCTVCKRNLKLSDVETETKCGLGSLFYNFYCGLHPSSQSSWLHIMQNFLMPTDLSDACTAMTCM